MLYNCFSRLIAVGLVLIFQTCAVAAEPPSEVITLLEKAAEIDLQYEEKDTGPYFEKLLTEAEHYRSANVEKAEAWIACAHMRANIAKTKGMSGLSMMKEARTELEKAIELNPNAMNGYAQVLLGRFYYLLPAWPISYGSDKKAKKYIESALSINGSELVNNYVYGLFHLCQKDYELAKKYLLIADQARIGTDRPNWEANFRKGIAYYLDYIAENSK